MAKSCLKIQEALFISFEIYPTLKKNPLMSELFDLYHILPILLIEMTLTAQTLSTVFADLDAPTDLVDLANASLPVHSKTSPAALCSPTAAATKTPACPCWQGRSLYSMASSQRRLVTFAGMASSVRLAVKFGTALRTMGCDAQDARSFVLTRSARSSAALGYLLPVALESDEIWRVRRKWSPDVDPAVALDALVGCNCCQRWCCCCCWVVIHCVDAAAFSFGHPWGPEVTWMN